MLVYFFFFTAITSHISQQSFQERMTQNIWSKRDSVLSSRTKEWNCSFSAAVQRLHNHNHDMQMFCWVVIWACFAASHWIDHDLCIKLVRNWAMILSTTENLQQNGGKVNFLKDLNELKQQLKEVWTKIPLQQCQKLPNHTVINYFDLLVLRLDLESQGVLDRKSGLHSDMWKHSFSHECTCVSHVMPPSIQF